MQEHKPVRSSWRGARTLALATACLALFALAQPAPARANAGPSLNVKSAILMDLSTGRVLYEQDADRQIAPASTTKIMTMYLVYEALRRKEVSLDQPVVISRRADAAGGTRMPVRPGDTPSLNEVMRGMAVVSGNNACIAAAEHVEGDVKSFVTLMNDTARSLGMTRTVFKNPNGLPARGQVTTARDMLTLATRYLKRYPESLRYHSQKYYYYNSYQGHNANTLLGECEGVDGLKTGFVASSGFNIVATARRDGHRLVGVVLGAESSRTRGRETEKLLELGFATLDGNQARVAQVKDSMTGRPQTVAAVGHRKKRKTRDVSLSAVESKSVKHRHVVEGDGPAQVRKAKSPRARVSRDKTPAAVEQPKVKHASKTVSKSSSKSKVKAKPVSLEKSGKKAKDAPVKKTGQKKISKSKNVARLALAVPGS